MADRREQIQAWLGRFVPSEMESYEAQQAYDILTSDPVGCTSVDNVRDLVNGSFWDNLALVNTSVKSAIEADLKGILFGLIISTRSELSYHISMIVLNIIQFHHPHPFGLITIIYSHSLYFNIVLFLCASLLSNIDTTGNFNTRLFRETSLVPSC